MRWANLDLFMARTSELAWPWNVPPRCFTGITAVIAAFYVEPVRITAACGATRRSRRWRCRLPPAVLVASQYGLGSGPSRRIGSGKACTASDSSSRVSVPLADHAVPRAAARPAGSSPSPVALTAALGVAALVRVCIAVFPSLRFDRGRPRPARVCRAGGPALAASSRRVLTWRA